MSYTTIIPIYHARGGNSIPATLEAFHLYISLHYWVDQKSSEVIR